MQSYLLSKFHGSQIETLSFPDTAWKSNVFLSLDDFEIQSSAQNTLEYICNLTQGFPFFLFGHKCPKALG